MALSLYDITVPVMIRGLRTLDDILDKARAHAAETGVAEADLLEARLAPDMLTLVGQIQRASDTAKFAAVRLGQVPTVSMADTEARFDDLKARLVATIDFLQAAPVEGFLGREEAEVILTFPGGQQAFKGQEYALNFVLPNFFFHLTTAYDILRYKGVPVGKRDYLGG